VKDPISLKDILSPAEAISTKVKSDAMNDVQGLYFRKPLTETMEDEQGSHFKQTSSPTPQTTAPKRNSTNKKQRRERVPKLRDLHPKDPTKVPHRYPKRGNRTVKSGQTLTSSDDDTHDVADNLPSEDADNEDDNDTHDVADNLPPEDADNEDDNNIIAPPTDLTAPSVELQQQFLRTCDTHIADQIDSFVYLRDNAENENSIWKEFEVTLQDGNGNVKLGPDGKPMIAIAPPPSDSCGRVFLTKPDERGEVQRARVVELIKDFEGNVAKNKDLIKFKLE
jgi:hypothetical protein